MIETFNELLAWTLFSSDGRYKNLKLLLYVASGSSLAFTLAIEQKSYITSFVNKLP